MSLWRSLKQFCDRLLQFLPHNRGNKLLAMLCQEYAEESHHSVQFKAHAERMHYPQFREALLRISQAEQKHAEWLEEEIIRLGGEVPLISAIPEWGVNSWEQLRLDLEAESRCVSDLTEQLATSKEIDPEIAKGLHRLLDEEKIHREAIRDMLMRSDPQAVWPI